MRAVFGTALAAAALWGTGAGAAAAPASTCRMEMAADLKVDFRNNRPTVEVRVNGRPARALIDTGSWTTQVMRPSAEKLGLSLRAMDNLLTYGAGGAVRTFGATIQTFEVAGVTTRDLPVPVIGQSRRTQDVDMLIGYDWLSRFDLEFDLANGHLRLLHAQKCADVDMPYWATTYSQAPLQNAENAAVVTVGLNGGSVLAHLDSGAATSVLAPAAAERNGVPLGNAKAAGLGRGVGPVDTPLQIAALDRFSIGTETINHPRIVVGDLFAHAKFTETGSFLGERVDGLPDMLLGADFLKSHRVLVSPSHRKIYFTYGGGPVFTADPVQAAAAPPTGASG